MSRQVFDKLKETVKIKDSYDLFSNLNMKKRILKQP